MTRAFVLIAMLAGCGGTYVCHSPCVGGTATTLFLCDGGQCPVGEAGGTSYLQCTCGSGHSLIVAEPDQPASCQQLKSQWSAFYDTNCH